MPREYRNFNNIGKVSGILLLLTFLIINPTTNSSAFAEEDVEDSYSVTNFASSDNIDDADDVALLADTNTSIVGISFSPATYYQALSPTNAAGQSAKINLTATVDIHNSGGYAVYLKSNSTDLVGIANSGNIIPGATTAKTYTNMDVNTWGYASAVGTAITDGNTYKKVEVSGNGDKLAENTSTKITSDTKTINLSFATKINNAKPADTYSNTMMLSVVSSPMQVTFTDYITNMQDMNPTICDLVSQGAEAQLKDTRDGKYYWVSKLADNRCWMTQNLDLDLDASTTPLTAATSDVTNDWTPGDAGKNPAYTETTASEDTIYNNDTGQRSWSLGNYRITNPTMSADCGYPRSTAADCPYTFTAYNTPTTANNDANAHYILGNHYQWNAATAGTGGTITSSTQAQASSSICPKGWRLPTSASSGEFQALIIASNIGNNVTAITSAPYYFVRGGDVWQSSILYNLAGKGGYYWSSTPYSGTYSALLLHFENSNDLYSSSSYGREHGNSVRCIAK